MCAKLLEIIGIGKVQMRAMDVIFHMFIKKRDAASTGGYKLFKKAICPF